MATKYAEVTYPNTGGGTEFTIPFEYLEQSHLEVTLDDVTQVNGTDYTINETTSKVVFSGATPASDVVVIVRTTPISTADLAVTFSDGSGLNAEALNDSAKQNIFAVQEMNDTIDESIDIVATAMLGANNLSDVDSTSTSRTNLDVYSKTETDSIFADGSNSLLQSQNLSDVDSASTSRTNLGLGTIATQDSGSVTITGGDISGITDLGISDGGTGASSKTVAFDNLSPTTTKGDIIASDGSDNIRLGVGTNDYILTADSTETSGMKWAVSSSAAGCFSVYLAADQTLSTSTETLITLNTESFDSEGWFDNSTYKFQPDVAGKYLVTYQIRVNTADGKAIAAYLKKNGSTYESISSSTLGAAYYHSVGNSKVVTMNGSTDYLQLYGWHNVGTNEDVLGVNYNTFMSGCLVEKA